MSFTSKKLQQTHTWEHCQRFPGTFVSSVGPSACAFGCYKAVDKMLAVAQVSRSKFCTSCPEERNFTLKSLAEHRLRIDFYLFISHELPVRFSVSQSQVWFEIQMTANILTLQYTYGCRMTLHQWVCDNIAPVGGWWHYPCWCVGIMSVGGW